MPKKLLLALLSLLCLTAAGFLGWQMAKSPNPNPFKMFTKRVYPELAERARPLDKYSFEALSQRNWEPQEIKIEGPIERTYPSIKKPYNFTSHLVSFMVDGKKVTGQLNLPVQLTAGHPELDSGPINIDPGSQSGTAYPVILMLRGYMPLENYQTGDGTKNAAAVFAQNGFITIAPDFLGYGGSDPRDPDEITGRLESYPIALTLLKSVENLKLVCASEVCPLTSNLQSPTSIFLYGHSNGGHLAIATLEISKRPIPTVLWAPVSKPWPFSTLFFTDEADDKGKGQRKALAKFEEDYDVFKYSVDNYFDWITAPIELHQGLADDAVPYQWSNTFYNTLKEKDKDITYFKYPGTNHDLAQSWNLAIARSLSFFQKHLQK
jgi:alpha-beta hydrolase superfamily lysophospholipase